MDNLCPMQHKGKTEKRSARTASHSEWWSNLLFPSLTCQNDRDSMDKGEMQNISALFRRRLRTSGNWVGKLHGTVRLHCTMTSRGQERTMIDEFRYEEEVSRSG